MVVQERAGCCGANIGHHIDLWAAPELPVAVPVVHGRCGRNYQHRAVLFELRPAIRVPCDYLLIHMIIEQPNGQKGTLFKVHHEGFRPAPAQGAVGVLGV